MATQLKFCGGEFGPVQFSLHSRPDNIDERITGHIATKCAIVVNSTTPISGLGSTDFAFFKRCSVNDASGKAYNKLTNEGVLLKSLNHENIVKLYIGSYEGLVGGRNMLYIATEFSDETVYDFLRSNKDLHPGLVKSWSVQATEALNYTDTRRGHIPPKYLFL